MTAVAFLPFALTLILTNYASPSPDGRMGPAPATIAGLIVAAARNDSARR
ncbi:MAG TPA: hypothetical protein VNS34_07090 [Rhizobiaceae bacterium]|nr:hypothetical protein [Rhizobiaceae bacterium]